MIRWLMNHKIIILESAEYDLKELKNYIIKNFSFKIWQHSYRKIKEAIRNLKTFPYAGSIPEELSLLNLNHYRQIVSGMNRIIYEVRGDCVYIHIIADTRQDF